MTLQGTRSFIHWIKANENKIIVLGWVLFPSKEIRDLDNKQVPKDTRMADLVTPLVNPEKLIFDASRMVYGGFHPLVQ
jgi:uncharacterized protein YbaA (DUF1428 family)